MTIHPEALVESLVGGSPQNRKIESEGVLPSPAQLAVDLKGLRNELLEVSVKLYRVKEIAKLVVNKERLEEVRKVGGDALDRCEHLAVLLRRELDDLQRMMTMKSSTLQSLTKSLQPQSTRSLDSTNGFSKID